MEVLKNMKSVKTLAAESVFTVNPNAKIWMKRNHMFFIIKMLKHYFYAIGQELVQSTVPLL